MKQFVSKNCTNLEEDERNELAATAVLAQHEYTVKLCFDNSSKIINTYGLPMTGIWVMPNVLGRRDVIIVW
jgi:hypothetical protein